MNETKSIMSDRCDKRYRYVAWDEDGTCKLFERFPTLHFTEFGFIWDDVHDPNWNLRHDMDWCMSYAKVYDMWNETDRKIIHTLVEL